MKAPDANLTELETFCAAFFSPPNQIVWKELDSAAEGASDLYAAANLWIAQARQREKEREKEKKHRACVLPVLNKGELSWVLLAANATEYARLLEEANAFFGVTLLVKPVKRYPLNGAGRRQQAAQAFFGPDVRAGYVSLGNAGSEGAKESLLKAKLWARIAANAANHSEADDVTLGKTLRKFRLALAALDRPTAANCLRILRERGLMETRNRVFLQVQMLAAFAEGDASVWKEICSLKTFPELVVALRPRAVTEALICAVYHVHLAPKISTGSAVLCDKFAKALYPQFAPLYRARGTSERPEVLKSFLLRAVSLDSDPRPELRDEIMTLIPAADAEYNLWNSIAARLPISGRVEKMTPPSAGDSLEEARKLFLAGEYSAAQRSALQAESTPHQALLLLRCAAMIGDLASENSALQAMESLSAADCDSLMKSSAVTAHYREITGSEHNEAAIEMLPTDWGAWLQRLQQGKWDDALARQSAEAGATEWNCENVFAAGGGNAEFIALLEAVRENPADLCAGRPISEVFLDALPTLIRAFVDAMEASARPVTYMPVLACLNETLTYQFGLTDSNALALVLELAEPLLTAEVSHSAHLRYYKEFLDQIAYCWHPQNAAPAAIRLLLDLLDMAYAFPCPERLQKQRQDVAERAIGLCNEWFNQRDLTLEDKGYLAQIAKRCSLESHLALPAYAGGENVLEAAQENVFDWLNGKQVAIHTLLEPTALRVKQALQERCQCEVVVNFEHDGSPQLQQLAESADIFIIVTRSAKHAATKFIEQHRQGKALLRPKGRGSSGILATIQQFIADCADKKNYL